MLENCVSNESRAVSDGMARGFQDTNTTPARLVQHQELWGIQLPLLWRESSCSPFLGTWRLALSWVQDESAVAAMRKRKQVIFIVIISQLGLHDIYCIQWAASLRASQQIAEKTSTMSSCRNSVIKFLS